jgi:hypothetical protein
MARYAVAGVMVLTLLGVVVEDHLSGILAVTGFLAVLGLVRRLVSMVQADPSRDPLLLVVPVVAAVLVLLAVRAGTLRRPSALTLAVAASLVATGLAVLGPDYPLSEDLQSTLFWSVPLLWFFIGRAFLDDADLRRVLELVTIFGVAACAVGIIQATIGFPPWDTRWIEDRGYIALGIDGPHTLRPFGWSPSSSEFALTASFATVLCGVQLREAWRTRQRWLGALAGVGLAIAGTALLLSAVRTALLLTVAAAAVVAVASRRAHAGRLVVAMAACAVLLVGGTRLLDVETWPVSGVQGLVRRSLLGITEPLDPEQSTLRIHLEATELSLRRLDDRPLGAGLAYGATDPRNRAGTYVSAENDLGNSALAMGIPGVVLFAAMTVLGLRTIWRRVRATPTLVTLAALAVLVAALRFWWTGAHYAPSMLVWLVLGWADRPSEPQHLRG